MKQYHHLYLSPHIDDASLSCGGLIHQQRQAGETVLVVTIFAASPASKTFSAYVDWMHRIWGEPGEVVATRLAEDRASMAVLGCDAEYLPFSDCIYRGNSETKEWYYTSNKALFGAVHPDDLPLAEAIVEKITSLMPTPLETLIYAPLAVGYHVDHQLTRHAAWQLLERGYRVLFYEDYPYADPVYPYGSHSLENLYPLAAALADSEWLELKPQLRKLSAENMQAKVNSILAYGSQMEMLFGGDDLVASYVKSYALHVGQSWLAERLWVVGG